MKRIVVVILLVFLAGCMKQKLTSLEGMPANASVMRIHIKGEDCTWTPAVVKVEKGTRLILDVESVDQEYNFHLKAYDLKFVIPEGETKTAEIYTSMTGEFEFGCYIEKGKHFFWGGMVGKLIVE